MKKILSIFLMLVLVISLAGCSLLTEKLFQSIDDIKNSTQGSDEPKDPPSDNTDHTHDFVLYETLDPKCDTGGVEKYICACGEKRETPTEPLGHLWDENIEASRFNSCQRDGCDAFGIADGNGRYDDTLIFNFTEEKEAEIAEKYEQLFALLDNAAKYDSALHGYKTQGKLAEEYAAVDVLHTELYELVLYAVTQMQIAEIAYYCDMENADMEERYSYMMDYYNEILATFYSLSQPMYDSCYREFFYYGMTEEEIKAYLFDSNVMSDEEYMALNARNDAIKLAFYGLSDPASDSSVPALYAEFVKNNNRIAQIMGYDNYLEYAYKNEYARDYTYRDVSKIAEYIKEYIAPAYVSVYNKYISLMQGDRYTVKDAEDYYSQVINSFFESEKANTHLNDYIDIMTFTSNPDKQISFSDAFNCLMSDGNLFRGEYEAAFVTYLDAFELPVAYFGTGYDGPFTVAHEFGHYMNEVYNKSGYNQSFDLLEMHSHGNEMLYLYFLEDQLTKNGFKLVEAYHILITLDTVMAAIAVDTFERAVYTGSYTGTGADVIMADGVISADEYDSLYQYILIDFGVADYQAAEYWRYVTVTSPCYYVSYSVSALSALQLYEMANNVSLDAAKESYLKLFTYTDEKPYLNTEEVLLYAGMYSYRDEELYKSLSSFLKAL